MISFTPARVELLRKAAELFEKRAEQTEKGLSELGVPTMQLEVARGRVQAMLDQVTKSPDDELSAEFRAAARTALMLMRGKVLKVVEGELALGIPTENSSERIDEIASLLRMLDDQLDIESDRDWEKGATISFNDGPAIPAAEFRRRAEKLTGKTF